MPGTSYYNSYNEKADKKILKRSRNKERIIHQWMRCSTMRNMMREIIRSDDERNCFCFGLILLQMRIFVFYTNWFFPYLCFTVVKPRVILIVSLLWCWTNKGRRLFGERNGRKQESIPWPRDDEANMLTNGSLTDYDVTLQPKCFGQA